MESSIKKKIEHFCAYQERCHLDVSNKLKKLGVYGDEIDEYICYLLDGNFLCETRFAELFARGKFNNNDWGKIKIINELKSRNISEWNIKNALKQIDNKDYLEKLDKLCLKKIEQIDKSQNQIKSKILRALSYKGWEVDLIIRSINQLTK
tara:strand:- start:5752 stop:6201 length:450 start_codon:yes stop_codon:yes gene_type:complete